MMRTMRGIAPWIMMIVAVTFVGWMVFDVGMDVTGRSGGAPTTVATINGRDIDQQTLQAEVRRVLDQQRAAGGPSPSTLEESREVEDAVLEQMYQRHLLEGEYRRRRISVTDEELLQYLMNAPPPQLQQDPSFQTDGQFDLAKYQRWLQSGQDREFTLLLEADYRQNLIPQLKWEQRATQDVFVPDAKLWRMYRDQYDSITVSLVALVPQALFGREAGTVTGEELAAYYRAHRSDFERPAQAYLSFAAVSRRPNAADSAAALARAQSVRQEILDGADFAAVAARESADSASRSAGGDLGMMARGSIVEPFVDAALALRPGRIGEPVATQFGYHIIRLESRTADSLHASHILIPVDLYGEHLDEVDRRADSLDLFAAEQDDPAMLDVIAEGIGVPVSAAPPLTQGTRLQLGRFLVPDVHLWAFEALPGQTSQVIETDWAYYVFRVDSVRPAQVPPLEEVEEDVRREAERARTWERTRALAAEIASAIAEGADLAAAVAGKPVHMEAVGPFTRVSPSSVLRDAPEAIGASFGLPLGQPGGPYEDEYALYFVEPVRRVFADSAAFVQERESMRQAITYQALQARVQMIVASLRAQARVEDLREEYQAALRAAQQQQGQGVPAGSSPVGF